jgi:hypothetical protein
LSAIAVVLLAACGGEAAEDDAARDLSLASADSVEAFSDTVESMEPETEEPETEEPAPVVRRRPPAPPPPPPPPSIAAGTAVTIYAVDTVTSRHNSVGELLAAVVVDPGLDSRGREVLPVGSIFYGTIVDIAPAESPGGEGRMVFAYDRVEVDGASYAIATQVDSRASRMTGRGVTAGDAAKVGAGTVIGAVAGRIIGGNRTGTMVGAVAGTAAGVGIAAATRDVDILLDAGSAIWMVLPEGFSRR